MDTPLTAILRLEKLNPVERFNERINTKIIMLTKYLRKDEEGLALINGRFNNVRSFDLIEEDNLRTHLRLKADIVNTIADYKARIALLRTQRLNPETL